MKHLGWCYIKNRNRRWLIFTGIGIISIFFTLFFLSPKPAVVPPQQQDPEPQLRMVEGTVKEKSSLYESLVREKIPIRWVDLIILKLKPHVDFSRIKGGTYHFATDLAGQLVRFLFEKSPTEVYEVEKGLHGYVVNKREVSLQRYLLKVEGEIHSSLFEAMEAAGEQDQLTFSFADILAWEIDFYKDVQQRDRFKMVVEKIYKGSQFIQYGMIHALEYAGGEKVIRGFRYQDDYYDEKGTSLRKAFLKAPLQFNRVSSGFSRARKHPVLGGVLPHLGVDYAAPPGTPVWAVADGAIVSAKRDGGFGKQVILQHGNGYRTYYNHLSRYGPGIRKGLLVRQKRIIGYVGSTGLSTGPHLDYRITKGGQFRNALKEIFPPGSPIDRGKIEKFQETKEEMLAWMNDASARSRRLADITSNDLIKCQRE